MYVKKYFIKCLALGQTPHFVPKLKKFKPIAMTMTYIYVICSLVHLY